MLFLNTVFKFNFGFRKKLKIRKLRKKPGKAFRFFKKQKFFRFWNMLYPIFKFPGAGFGICFPKGRNFAYFVAFGIFRRGFKLMIMNMDPVLYIIRKAGIKRTVFAKKGIYPVHQISRTARTFPSSFASPTTNPAFLKSLFARLFSREYAAQSFFASPRGYSFTILIAS